MDIINEPSKLYFGYGSNLWLKQMQKRCPSSKYLGVGRLNGYRWQINTRGYANVVQVSRGSGSGSSTTASKDYSTVAYGLVYALNADDEKTLDRYEGVPAAYEKDVIVVDFWSSLKDDASVGKQKMPASRQRMLVYVNRTEIEDGEPKEEYIYRMNMAIEDGLAQGIPKAYVEQVMRKYIPVQDNNKTTDALRRINNPMVKQDKT